MKRSKLSKSLGRRRLETSLSVGLGSSAIATLRLRLEFDLRDVAPVALTSLDSTIQHERRNLGRSCCPPDSLNATSKTASMAVHDYSTRGEYVPPRVVEQAKQFIAAGKLCSLFGTAR